MASPALAGDGYRLWLRYPPAAAHWRSTEAPRLRVIVARSRSPTVNAASDELGQGFAALLGRTLPRSHEIIDGTVLLGTPQTSKVIAALRLPLGGLGDEGFILRSTSYSDKRIIVVAANGERGLLYGSFALLREAQQGRSLAGLDLRQKPASPLRMLNHWDNLDGFVERGYAGRSLWRWAELPGQIDPRLIDYARANASVGINATVLTNVNADATVLTPDYLRKVAAIAGALRPWGMRTFLTARFSAPIDIGGLPTADPTDPRVRRWWKAKAGEIYRIIPDFGGFLVKANSEGQPGPGDYGRSHAEGANMLADALAPHGGTLLWRAFVYQADPGSDRARQAFDEFKPLDGRFRRNVILQAKNGPIDFQPREPFHPLFGQMPATRLALEVQATKEYLGFSTHLAYLGPMWAETLHARTEHGDRGPNVADSLTAMAAVANTGDDRNWTGSDFDQANWYAFGRLAWDHALSPRAVAEEWTRQTWSHDPAVVSQIVGMMMRSREAVVDYMTPLGLHHLMASGHHHGPGPWVDDLPRADWNPTYFHRADERGIGFDRTASGSNAISQYRTGVARCFARRDCVPDEHLLWFHRVGWDERMQSGRTLWEELLSRYERGVQSVGDMRGEWAALDKKLDPERHQAVSAKLAQQEKEARWWRDASIAYWQFVSRRPLPPEVTPPPHDLATYRAIRLRNVPGDPE
ncbi:alpha-glucuronidase family glycosyl hydrolase [Sphingomonas sp. LHG3406-1]|uniref:alpha-glucuronidase family glycosyl hydrolase n=1 Tax=Sphingomonas sp. LHG3406-1 TaxID=2804617 RepID=UPI00345D6AE4